jgi:hypothetical protein
MSGSHCRLVRERARCVEEYGEEWVEEQRRASITDREAAAHATAPTTPAKPPRETTPSSQANPPTEAQTPSSAGHHPSPGVGQL